LTHCGEHGRIIACVLGADLQNKYDEKTAELAAQLQVRERLHSAQLTQLSRQKSEAELRAEALERENAQLRAQLSQFCETTVLLKEEIAWLKAQFFGRSSEKSDAAELSPDQRMLFNEAEVLAAIAAADAAERAPIPIAGHERTKKSGSKVIPAQFPREIVPHDLAESQKVCPSRWHAP